MRGLYLVGIDHQHRLGVDFGIGRQQQILVGQPCIGAVGTCADADATMEDHAAAVRAHTAPYQFAGGVARDVLDAQPRVHMPAAVAEQHAIGGQLGVVAFQAHVELVPRQAGTQFQVHALVARVARQHRVGAQQRRRMCAAGLHARVRQRCALCQMHVHHAVLQMGGVADMQVMLDYLQRSAGTQFDQMAVMPRQILLAGHADEHQMQWQLDLRAGMHAHQHAFVGKRGIQARKDLVAAVEAAAQ